MTEHNEQQALFSWADYAQCQYPELALMFAIPNGQFRTGKGKPEPGLRAGVPDIFLPAARGGCHGMFIEMKVVRADGRKTYPRKEQREWMAKLSEQGYYAVVAWNWEQARDLIVRYLEGMNDEANTR